MFWLVVNLVLWGLREKNPPPLCFHAALCGTGAIVCVFCKKDWLVTFI